MEYNCDYTFHLHKKFHRNIKIITIQYPFLDGACQHDCHQKQLHSNILQHNAMFRCTICPVHIELCWPCFETLSCTAWPIFPEETVESILCLLPTAEVYHTV